MINEELLPPGTMQAASAHTVSPMKSLESPEAIKEYAQQAAQNLQTALQNLRSDLSEAGYSSVGINNENPYTGLDTGFQVPSVPETITPFTGIKLTFYTGLKPKADFYIDSWKALSYHREPATPEEFTQRIREQLHLPVQEDRSTIQPEAPEKETSPFNWQQRAEDQAAFFAEQRRDRPLAEVLTPAFLFPLENGLVIRPSREQPTRMEIVPEGSDSAVIQIMFPLFREGIRLSQTGNLIDLDRSKVNGKFAQALKEAVEIALAQAKADFRVIPVIDTKDMG